MLQILTLEEGCFNVDGADCSLFWCIKCEHYLYAFSWASWAASTVALFLSEVICTEKSFVSWFITDDFWLYTPAKWNTSWSVSSTSFYTCLDFHCSSSVSFALISSSFDWAIKTSSTVSSSFDCSIFLSVVSGLLSTNLEMLFEWESDISQLLIAFRSMACFEPSWLGIFHQLCFLPVTFPALLVIWAFFYGSFSVTLFLICMFYLFGAYVGVL